MSTKNTRWRGGVSHSRVYERLVDTLDLIITGVLLSGLHKQEHSATQYFHNVSPTDLLLESRPLLERIVQLSVGIAELLSAHEPLKTFTQTRSRPVPFGQRGHDLGVAD
jgi:hypothetical protein